MMKFFVIILLSISPLFSLAQKQGNIWYFGDSAGISFNSLPPMALLHGTTNTTESSCTISDKSGNLLFYCGSSSLQGLDKMSVWNNNFTEIQNGTNLFGNGIVDQGVLLLPSSVKSNLTYLFQIGIPGFCFRLYYSVIDNDGNSGNGSVVVKNKLVNTSDTTITNKMIAVRHANGRDWWIILHGYGTNNFIKYLFQNDSIYGPFNQSIGSAHYNSGYGYAGAVGTMCISNDGNKLVCVTETGIIDLFDFDRCSGLIDNWISFGDNATQYYGCALSSDNSKLYITTAAEGGGNYTYLYQYDLNSSNIQNSKIEISRLTKPHWFGQLKLGIDDKIYCAKTRVPFPNTDYDSVNMYLGVIDFPDSLGSACHYNKNGLYLGGKRAFLGLPNIPNYALGKIEGSECDTIRPPIIPDTPAVIYIPNIFSPNGDNQNDQFRIRGEQIASIHLIIYNRWGNLVFESNELNNGWDGTQNGQQCEEGVYAYRAEIRFNDGKEMDRNGTITLVR